MRHGVGLNCPDLHPPQRSVHGSDMPGGGENISEYNNFWNDAPVATFKAVESLIENI